MKVDISGLPRRITLAAGDRAEIPLPSYAGSGNAWSVSCIRGQEVASVELGTAEVSPIPTGPRDGTAEPPPLALVQERAVVVGLARGVAVWRLLLARSFDVPGEPAAALDFEITVVAAR
jgi:hypothetical protein